MSVRAQLEETLKSQRRDVSYGAGEGNRAKEDQLPVTRKREREDGEGRQLGISFWVCNGCVTSEATLCLQSRPSGKSPGVGSGQHPPILPRYLCSHCSGTVLTGQCSPFSCLLQSRLQTFEAPFRHLKKLKCLPQLFVSFQCSIFLANVQSE